MIDVEKSFAAGPRIQCSLELPAEGASVTVLFGPSGAGKTTILRCVAGLERPDRGTIRFGDETWFDSARGIDLAPQERRAGLLFQDHALFPHLSVAANVAYGLGDLPAAERRRRVEETLALLRLDGLAERRPAQLSGGEKQRVSLGRVLAPRPRLLLLDEPLSALDAPTREALRGELRRLLSHVARPTLLVTHDRIEALALGDRIAVISDGRLRLLNSTARDRLPEDSTELAKLAQLAHYPGPAEFRRAAGPQPRARYDTGQSRGDIPTTLLATGVGSMIPSACQRDSHPWRPSLPARFASATRFATRLMLLASETDEPPYFCTMRATRVRSGDGCAIRPRSDEGRLRV